MTEAIDLNEITVEEAKRYLAELADQLTLENTGVTLAQASRLLQIERLHPAVTALGKLFWKLGELSRTPGLGNVDQFRYDIFDLAKQVSPFAEKYEREEMEARISAEGLDAVTESFGVSRRFARYVVDAQIKSTNAERLLASGYSIWLQESVAYKVDFNRELKVHVLHATRQSDGRLFIGYFYPGSETVEFSTANVNPDAERAEEVRVRVLDASRISK